MMSIFCLRFKNLTKLFLIVLTLIVLTSSINFASDLSEQISEAQCITEYDDDTDIEDMDTVTFGSYSQSSSNSKEPIEWIVLDKQGDKALLLSKYILDEVILDNTTGGLHRVVDENSSYNTLDIRKWLNNDFFNTAFNENDKKQILQVHIPETSIESKNNENLDIYISSEVSDKVFFLSTEECEKYFLATQGTYGLTYFKRGAITESTNYANKTYADADVDFNVHTYWLRTYKKMYRDGNWWDTSFTCIQMHSDDFSHELVADTSDVAEVWGQGVRPAIWVSLSNSNSNSNSAGYITEEGWIRANPNMPVVELKEFDKEKADKVTVTRSVWEQLPEGLKSQFREDQIIDDNVQETTKQAPKNGWDGDYYYQNDVPVKNTWVDYGSDKYYCGSTGAILKNQWIDNTYYVDNTGKMLKNTTTPDGYKVGADGKYIKETKAPETKVQETKPQETKPQETKPKETKAAEINVQETKAKANTNTTTNLSNKFIPLSEEELNDLEETSLFSLTINNKYVDFINIGSMNDGFLGLFGNKKYYVRFGYKLKLPEEELVTDYGNKYNNIDGNVIDCLGNKIKKYSYWIPSYTIYTDSKQTAENIKEYIESGNDYTAYFFDAMIESTGKYKADPKSAIFKVPFTSDMVKYARPSKTPNIKLEQDDDGVELIDGYGMSVKIGKDNSEVRIEFNKNISEDLREKIMNYDLGHQTVGTNIIDNYGHKILKFYYSSFGTYAIYAENYQEAEEIASELNNNDCDYTLYFYDNVKESTGKYKADKSKALFNAALTADMIKNAVYTKTKDMKVVTAENGLQIMEGLNVSVDVGKDVYEIRIELDKTYKGDLKEKIANYYFGHQDIGTNIIDNYGHKILRFYDSSFGTYAIHAETEEEAKEITSVLNSSNCNYVLYFFDNVIESTGKNKVDTGSAKFNVKFTKDMVKYATAKQNVERTVVKDAEGFELMDGLAVSIEEGNDLFEVRIEMNKNMSESNKNKIATYDVAHFEGYGKDVVKTKIYDNYGHRINRFYDSSFGTFMINAENLDQAKEIASELNSSTCDYTLYFFD